MAEVTWTEQALDDVDAVGVYIRQFNVAAADRLERRLRSAGDSLRDQPFRGRPFRGDIRVLTHVRPYLLFYRVRGGEVLLLTVRHGARRPL